MNPDSLAEDSDLEVDHTKPDLTDWIRSGVTFAAVTLYMVFIMTSVVGLWRDGGLSPDDVEQIGSNVLPIITLVFGFYFGQATK